MSVGKLVLSRKGLDTTSRKNHPSGRVHPYGGVPSPIFPGPAASTRCRSRVNMRRKRL